VRGFGSFASHDQSCKKCVAQACACLSVWVPWHRCRQPAGRQLHSLQAALSPLDGCPPVNLSFATTRAWLVLALSTQGSPQTMHLQKSK
jgi:hypothetical protein